MRLVELHLLEKARAYRPTVSHLAGSGVFVCNG